MLPVATRSHDTEKVRSHRYDLERMRRVVEGKEAEVAVTLKGPMTPEEVLRAFMEVDVDVSGTGK